MKKTPKRAKGRDLWLSLGKYIAKHPDQLFWQALAHWSKKGCILASKRNEIHICEELEDTYYWEGKDK